jgi:hypothetical protein
MQAYSRRVEAETEFGNARKEFNSKIGNSEPKARIRTSNGKLGNFSSDHKLTFID